MTVRDIQFLTSLYHLTVGLRCPFALHLMAFVDPSRIVTCLVLESIVGAKGATRKNETDLTLQIYTFFVRATSPF